MRRLLADDIKDDHNHLFDVSGKAILIDLNSKAILIDLNSTVSLFERTLCCQWFGF